MPFSIQNKILHSKTAFINPEIKRGKVELARFFLVLYVYSVGILNLTDDRLRYAYVPQAGLDTDS